MAKNVFIAYILWFFLGAFGVHHFYLRRDRHAFVWWTTFGGAFGLGWFRDVFKIPEYVSDANESREYLRSLKEYMKFRKKPSSNTTRWLGQLFTGYLYGWLVRLAVPEELVSGEVAETRGWFSIWTLLLLATPCGVALGVYVVANIGREQCSLKWPLMGAYIWILLPQADMSGFLVWMAITSTIAANWKGKTWRKLPYERHGFCKRVFILGVCGTLYLSLWGSMFYNNAYITSADGEKVKLRDAIHNFFKSPAWAETKKTFSEMWDYYKLHGFEKMWDELVKALDPEGEENAYKVLNVSKTATQSEITSAYRKLVKQYHPDKQKDPTKKEEAANKFMEIQQAYETLSKIKSRRSRKSRNTEHSERFRDEF